MYLQLEEEARSLQKKIQTIENDLDQTQEQLTQANTKIEEKDKALETVSDIFTIFILWVNGIKKTIQFFMGELQSVSIGGGL